VASESIVRILHFIKEYWFLITLGVSGVIAFVYMVVFHVTPWDKHREVKDRRQLSRFHNLAGRRLLESGHFQQAKQEFKEAINLSSTDVKALNGLYLTELFLALESPEWDPAVSLAVQDHLTNLGVIERDQLLHVVEKYKGDVHSFIGEIDQARKHYDKALAIKPDYVDALFALGWFCYDIIPDINQMEQYFRNMVEVDRFDYRGFHGLGYALYMQAVAEPDFDRRRNLTMEAAQQSEQARNLSVTRLNIVMDFAEVARSVNPALSVYFHNRGNQIVNDPILSQANENPFPLRVKLLLGTGSLILETPDHKRAWIQYQLALDYLAMFRMESKEEQKQEYDRLLEAALDIDKSREIHPLFLDQFAILDLLLPG